MKRLWFLTTPLLLTACGSGVSAEALAKCRSEAVAYYRVIGSYPTLSDGGSADDLIEEKCRFNPEMFKDMPL